MTDTSPDPSPLSTPDGRQALRSLGYPELPEIVKANWRSLERGHHLAIVAGGGSGKEILFALGALLHGEPEASQPLALLLSATPEGARRSARAAEAIGRAEGVHAFWLPPRLGTPGVAERPPLPATQAVAGTPDAVLAEVRSGRLRLGAVRLFVLDETHVLEATGDREAAEAILDALDPETQRIVCTARPDPTFAALIERRLPRARRWPPELLPVAGDREAQGAEETEGPEVWAAAGRGEEARLELLSAGLERLSAEHDAERAAVRCPGPAVARRVAATLASLGFRVTDDPELPGVAVASGEEPLGGAEVAALFGLPTDLSTVRAWLEPATARMAVVEPAQLDQLAILARRLGWPVRQLPEALAPAVSREIERFRETVRDRARSADVSAELLLLEPLLDEFGAHRLAAVLAAMWRERAAGEGRTEKAGEAGEPPTSVLPAWTRIFLNVGKRDGAGPGDIVGAITGETGAAAAQIGKIEVRSNHTLVELDSLIADDVIAGLNGARIKGRTIVARRDRAT